MPIKVTFTILFIVVTIVMATLVVVRHDVAINCISHGKFYYDGIEYHCQPTGD